MPFPKGHFQVKLLIFRGTPFCTKNSGESKKSFIAELLVWWFGLVTTKMPFDRGTTPIDFRC